MRKHLALPFAISLVGCVAAPYTPARLFQTKTPGVAFVVVHPGFSDGMHVPSVTRPDGALVTGDAEYIVVCDARGAVMRCELTPEASSDRASYAPSASAKPIHGEIGALLPSASVQLDVAPPPSTSPSIGGDR